jgi:hypothetical protein
MNVYMELQMTIGIEMDVYSALAGATFSWSAPCLLALKPYARRIRQQVARTKSIDSNVLHRYDLGKNWVAQDAKQQLSTEYPE